MLVRRAEARDAEAVLLIHRQAVEQGNRFVREAEEFSATVDSKLKQIERMASSTNSRLVVAELDGMVELERLRAKEAEPRRDARNGGIRE